MKSMLFEAAAGRGGIRRPIGRRLARWLRQATQRGISEVRLWRRRSRDRAQLATFDDRMLRDIGLSRADVWREVNKPFWRK